MELSSDFIAIGYIITENETYYTVKYSTPTGNKTTAFMKNNPCIELIK